MLSSPERLGFDDGRGHRDDLVELAILKELSQADIDKLLVLVLGKESVLGGHEYTGNHRVLDKTSDRLSTCWNYILSMSCH